MPLERTEEGEKGKEPIEGIQRFRQKRQAHGDSPQNIRREGELACNHRRNQQNKLRRRKIDTLVDKRKRKKEGVVNLGNLAKHGLKELKNRGIR